MKTSKEVRDFLGDSDPVRNSVDTIKQCLSFLSITYGSVSERPNPVANAYVSSLFAILYRFEDYLVSSGEILPF